MDNKRPWEQLQILIDGNSKEKIKEYLDNMRSEDIVNAVSHISEDDQTLLARLLSPEDAADLMEDLPRSQAINTIKDLDAKDAAAIISEMSSDDQADFLIDLDKDNAEAIMVQMDTEEAEAVRTLIKYDPDTAGGLMITEFLAFEDSNTVGIVVKDLSENAEKYKKYNLQYIYVTHDGLFSGVLSMRDLLLSKSNTVLSKIVLKDALFVSDHAPFEEIIQFFDEHNFYGVPVLNYREELVGVVLREDFREAEEEKVSEDFLVTQGIVGGEELRTMPILLRAKRRLSWLSVNILLNILAASVIAFYQETLTAVIALAVFLPIISDMSGCSGNQAVAVSLRELALGVVRPFEIFRVLWQEVWVGVINGLVLGILIGFAAFLWKGSIVLGLVIGGALAINTVVAVSLGGTIPLFLRRLNVDPALASGPILTTVTDMLGFLFALSFATLMLEYI
jgi:magnesium transporter